MVKTKAIEIVGAFGGIVAVLEPLESTEPFSLQPFSDDLDGFPFTPVLICSAGVEYAHCGCEREADAMDVIKQSCFGTSAVFLFLLEQTKIRHGWYVRKIEFPALGAA